MKKSNFIALLLISLPIYIFAQTAAINPSRIVVGSASSSLPSGDSELLNVPFAIWNSAATGWYSPALQLGSPNGKLTVAVANEVGAFGAIGKGDVIFRPSKGARMIFNLNTQNEVNTRKVLFGTAQNSFKTLVVSNADKVGMGTDIFPINLSFVVQVDILVTIQPFLKKK